MGFLFIIIYILYRWIFLLIQKWHCRWIPFLHGFEFSYLNQGRWDDRWYLILLVQLSYMLFLRYVVDQTCCATWLWFCLFAIGIILIFREHGWIGCFSVSSRMGQFSHLRWHSLWGPVRLPGQVWIIVCVSLWIVWVVIWF